jgi:hypothetical protein
MLAHTTLAAAPVLYDNTAYASGLDTHYADALVGGMLQGRASTILDGYNASGVISMKKNILAHRFSLLMEHQAQVLHLLLMN